MEIAPAHKTKLTNLPCIEKKKSIIKYLGVYLDDKFSWSFQIQHIINKLSKSLSIFYKLRHLLSLDLLKQL